MAWLLCCACHYRAEVKPVKKGKKYRCSACGSYAIRALRVLKLSMLNGGQVPRDMAKKMTYGALISIAHHRGYKLGWAAVKYRCIYGDWPPDGDAVPERPSGELMWYIRKQNAEYAKARKAEEGAKPLPLLSGSELMTDDDWAVEL